MDNHSKRKGVKLAVHKEEKQTRPNMESPEDDEEKKVKYLSVDALKDFLKQYENWPVKGDDIKVGHIAALFVLYFWDEDQISEYVSGYMLGDDLAGDDLAGDDLAGDDLAGDDLAKSSTDKSSTEEALSEERIQGGVSVMFTKIVESKTKLSKSIHYVKTICNLTVREFCSRFRKAVTKAMRIREKKEKKLGENKLVDENDQVLELRTKQKEIEQKIAEQEAILVDLRSDLVSILVDLKYIRGK